MYSHHISSCECYPAPNNPLIQCRYQGLKCRNNCFHCVKVNRYLKHKSRKTNVWPSASKGRCSSDYGQSGSKQSLQIKKKEEKKTWPCPFNNTSFLAGSNNKSGFLYARPLACALTSPGRSDMWRSADTSALTGSYTASTFDLRAPFSHITTLL